MFNDPGLVAELAGTFEAGIAPASAWQPALAADGSLQWRDASARVWTHEPETGVALRAMVRVLRLLPIDSQL